MQKTPPAWLRNASPVVFTAFASLAGFTAYFSMYAFRKPFTAASFDHVDGWHYALDFKIALVLAQLVGYAASKFIGIKVIAEMRQTRYLRAEEKAMRIPVLMTVPLVTCVLPVIITAP